MCFWIHRTWQQPNQHKSAPIFFKKKPLAPLVSQPSPQGNGPPGTPTFQGYQPKNNGSNAGVAKTQQSSFKPQNTFNAQSLSEPTNYGPKSVNKPQMMKHPSQWKQHNDKTPYQKPTATVSNTEPNSYNRPTPSQTLQVRPPTPQPRQPMFQHQQHSASMFRNQQHNTSMFQNQQQNAPMFQNQQQNSMSKNQLNTSMFQNQQQNSMSKNQPNAMFQNQQQNAMSQQRPQMQHNAQRPVAPQRQMTQQMPPMTQQRLPAPHTQGLFQPDATGLNNSFNSWNNTEMKSSTPQTQAFPGHGTPNKSFTQTQKTSGAGAMMQKPKPSQDKNTTKVFTLPIQYLNTIATHTHNVIYEIFGKLNSHVLNDKQSMKSEFVLVDGKDNMECVFFEIDRPLGKMNRGFNYRCVGLLKGDGKFHCLSVRPATDEEMSSCGLMYTHSKRLFATIVSTVNEL